MAIRLDAIVTDLEHYTHQLVCEAIVVCRSGMGSLTWDEERLSLNFKQ